MPGDVTLSQIPIAALIEGFRFNPSFDRLIFADPPQVAGGRRVSAERTYFFNRADPQLFQR